MQCTEISFIKLCNFNNYVHIMINIHIYYIINLNNLVFLCITQYNKIIINFFNKKEFLEK